MWHELAEAEIEGKGLGAVLFQALYCPVDQSGHITGD
jgi:hypothetical protein